MSKVHSKNTVITLYGVDMSVYCTDSELNRGADVHDTTTYGSNSHSFTGGLEKGTFTVAGWYETISVTGGPRPTLEPMIGVSGTIVRKPEGTGAGKAQDSFSAILEEYVESSPVADIVKWSAKFTITGDVTSTPQ